MCSPFRLKFAATVLLLLGFIFSIVLLGSTRLPVHADPIFAKLSPKLKMASASYGITCGAWNVVPSPNVLTGNNMLYGVAATSASNAWATGYYTYSYNNQDYLRILLEHWNGTSWSAVSSPNPGPGGDVLYSIVAISASSVWAVGASWDLSGNNVQALIEHWNGRSWKVSPSPAASQQLMGLTRVPGTNQLWAVGTGGLIEQWNGTSWNIVSSPTNGLLRGVAANTATDVWAVGQSSGGSYQTLIEHWDGNSWSVVSSPGFGTDNSALVGVTRVPGSNNAWTVGYDAPTLSPSQALTEYWNGTNWSVTPSPSYGPNNNFLSGVTAISSHNIWAVGGFVNDPANNLPLALIEHWNGKNWSIISNPSTGLPSSFLEAVTRVPSTTQLWAVGTSTDNNRLSQTLIEFYC
jgi:hypothetical protein